METGFGSDPVDGVEKSCIDIDEDIKPTDLNPIPVMFNTSTQSKGHNKKTSNLRTKLNDEAINLKDKPCVNEDSVVKECASYQSQGHENLSEESDGPIGVFDLITGSRYKADVNQGKPCIDDDDDDVKPPNLDHIPEILPRQDDGPYDKRSTSNFMTTDYEADVKEKPCVDNDLKTISLDLKNGLNNSGSKMLDDEIQEDKKITECCDDSICEHTPISSEKAIWALRHKTGIKKETQSPTELSTSLDPMVVHSKIDNLISENDELENDIAGSPMCNDSGIPLSETEPIVEDSSDVAMQLAGCESHIKKEPPSLNLTVSSSSIDNLSSRKDKLKKDITGNQSCSVGYFLLPETVAGEDNSGIYPNYPPVDKESTRNRGRLGMIMRLDLQEFNGGMEQSEKEESESIAEPLDLRVSKSGDNFSDDVTRCPTSDKNLSSRNLSRHLKYFHTEQDQDNAMESETEVQGYKYNQCHISSKQDSDLLTDRNEHKGEKPFKCNVCGKRYTQSYSLSQHMRIHTGEKPYKCNQCHKSFNQSGTLSKHMRIHTGEKPFKCDQCDKSFIQSANLSQHMRTHTGEKPLRLYRCEQCERSFSKGWDLQLHMRTHTGEKPYKCNHCDKSFSRKSYLHAHMKALTDGKPLKCNECDKSFSRKWDLQSHMRTHTGDKPFKCNHCDKSFNQSSHFSQHMRTHTGEKPFKCNQCDKSYSQSGSLSQHMRTHTGEKPFKCNLCEKGFIQSANLTQHMRTHTGEKPFKCNQCDKSFNQSAHLSKHMRMHSQEKSLSEYSDSNNV